MSEDLLKSLMHLYAIIAKQNVGTFEKELDYIRNFLSAQINSESVEKYISVFTIEVQSKKNDERVSVVDSVSVIAAAKKINNILTQKQKIVVLLRLFELIGFDKSNAHSKLEITKTISDIFNVSILDYDALLCFSFTKDYLKIVPSDILLFSVDKDILNSKDKLSDYVAILRIKSLNIFFYNVYGDIDVKWNGTKINNNISYVFANGGCLQFSNGKTIYYQEVVNKYFSSYNHEKINFYVKDVEYYFTSKVIGINKINLSEEQGKLIAIMGASGSGKTTLLNIISGIIKPTSGEVLVNGINIHTEQYKINGVLGYVPQDDLLIEELTVYQNLYYSSKLCFGNLPEKEIQTKVLNLLELIGLSEIKHHKVGNMLDKVISGGQRKRLNIALELIREPAILFLDEPTSGLSSRDSEKIINILTQLSSKGKLVFVVIHQPNSDIYKQFDKIIILDKGGYIIYNGNPIDCISYFKKADKWVNNEQGECASCGNVNPESVFNIIEAETLNEYGNYTGIRKVSPQKWHEYYMLDSKINYYNNELKQISSNLYIPTKIKQLFVFFRRDFFSKLYNRQYVIVNLIEIPLLAFILSFIVRYSNSDDGDIYSYSENDNIPAYIFMSIIVFSFTGISISAEEIFKDRKILKRERFLDLSKSAYLFSKIVLLFIISAIQCLLFVLIGNFIVEIKDMNFAYWLMLFSVSGLSNLIGLNISAAFNSVVTIYIIIPLLLIPQMILGGAMFNYEKLNKYIGGGYQVPLVAEFIPARWAYEGLMVYQFKSNKYEKKLYELEKLESNYNYMRGPYSNYLTKILNEIRKEMQINKNYLNSLKLMDRVVIMNNELNKINEEKNDITLKINNISVEKLSINSIDSLFKFIDQISLFYSKKLDVVVAKKNQVLYNLQKTQELKNNFIKLKKDYYNEHLSDIVKNIFSEKNIIVNDYQLIQVTNSVYNNPEPKSIFDFRSHFYSPIKQFMGMNIQTFSFNIIVIWMFSILAYAALYFEVLKKIINIKITLKI